MLIRRAFARQPTDVALGGVISLIIGWAVLAGRCLAATLETSLGDGQVSVSVNAYGSFGYETSGIGTEDAVYDPVGSGILTQIYVLTNDGAEAASFDLVRYYEGDLKIGTSTWPRPLGF